MTLDSAWIEFFIFAYNALEINCLGFLSSVSTNWFIDYIKRHNYSTNL